MPLTSTEDFFPAFTQTASVIQGLSTSPRRVQAAEMRPFSSSRGRQHGMGHGITFGSMATWALSTLLLLTANPANAQSAADYYVRSLPGAPEGPLLKMHAG